MQADTDQPSCISCPFFVSDGSRSVGRCHHVSLFMREVLDNFWCSEHPLRQRDRLAEAAMQGIIAGWKEEDSLALGDTPWCEEIAASAYAFADEMIRKREAVTHAPAKPTKKKSKKR